MPTEIPTVIPTIIPTETPSETPTEVPTVSPSNCNPEFIKFSCPEYCASNTNCALQDTSNCDISLCEGDIFLVTTGCCFRDTYIQLYLDDEEVAQNDDAAFNTCPYCEYNSGYTVRSSNLSSSDTESTLNHVTLLTQVFPTFSHEEPFQYCSLLFYQVPKNSCGCRKYQLRSGCYDNELW